MITRFESFFRNICPKTTKGGRLTDSLPIRLPTKVEPSGIARTFRPAHPSTNPSVISIEGVNSSPSGSASFPPLDDQLSSSNC